MKAEIQKHCKRCIDFLGQIGGFVYENKSIDGKCSNCGIDGKVKILKTLVSQRKEQQIKEEQINGIEKEVNITYKKRDKYICKSCGKIEEDIFDEKEEFIKISSSVERSGIYCDDCGTKIIREIEKELKEGL